MLGILVLSQICEGRCLGGDARVPPTLALPGWAWPCIYPHLASAGMLAGYFERSVSGWKWASCRYAVGCRENIAGGWP